MEIPDVKEKWTHKINEVAIGAAQDQGGTRKKIITNNPPKTIIHSVLPMFSYKYQYLNNTISLFFVRLFF